MVGPNLSPLHLAAAVVATVPLWVSSLLEEFPSYYFVGIHAGELLLIFVAGFVTSLLLLLFLSAGTTICQQCPAPIFFAGLPFDPSRSRQPHWSDLAILIALIALNIALWVALSNL